MIELTPEIVRELLDYDPETGAFVFRNRDKKWFVGGRVSAAHRAAAWNTQFDGRVTMTEVHTLGYRRGSIFGKNHYAHRIAWLHYYGEWPKCEIDHINGDRSDNRIANLRAVTRIENARNLHIIPSGAAGVFGVRERRGKWEAEITIRDRTYSLGKFASMEEAITARKAAESENGFHIDHGKKRRAA